MDVYLSALVTLGIVLTIQRRWNAPLSGPTPENGSGAAPGLGRN